MIAQTTQEFEQKLTAMKRIEIIEHYETTNWSTPKYALISELRFKFGEVSRWIGNASFVAYKRNLPCGVQEFLVLAKHEIFAEVIDQYAIDHGKITWVSSMRTSMGKHIASENALSRRGFKRITAKKHLAQIEQRLALLSQKEK